MDRAALVSELASRICALAPNPATRVAIDGVDASGKTTLADPLVEPIARAGRAVTRLCVDDFLNPAESRYRRGRDSPEGYYRDSFDYAAVRAAVAAAAAPGTVVVVDGVFLLRPELLGCWTFSIFLRASFTVTVARAVARDSARLGGAEATLDRYARRYVPGQELYFAEAQPELHASVIVDNDDFERPTIVACHKSL